MLSALAFAPVAALLTAAPLQVPTPSAEAQARMIEACVAPADRARPLTEFSPDEVRTTLACLTRHTADEIRKSLPAPVDAITTWDTVQAEGTTLTYRYTVGVEAAQVTDPMREALSNHIRQQACGNPDMTAVIALGGAYRYVWTDRAGRPLHELTVASC